MTRYRVIPYKPGSRSAKTLAEEIGGLRIKVRNSKFRAKGDDVVINWGSQVRPLRLADADILNPPEKIRQVSNKLEYFRMMERADVGVVPKWWTPATVADIEDNEFPVVCRTILDGHSGAGIVIANTRDELVDAPLYVKYVKKTQEYRIHVGRGEVIAQQRKARRLDVPDDEVNWQVRNHSNGFIFARVGVDAPQEVKRVAIAAVEAAGLDFGAVDVVYNERANMAFAIEINTAPGIEGSTVADYVKFFTGEVSDDLHDDARQ